MSVSSGGSFVTIFLYFLLVWVIIAVIAAVVLAVKAEKRRKKQKEIQLAAIIQKGNQAAGNHPHSSEDIHFARIYARQAGIPSDAVGRSAYIAWLVKEGHYEEADRVSAL